MTYRDTPAPTTRKRRAMRHLTVPTDTREAPTMTTLTADLRPGDVVATRPANGTPRNVQRAADPTLPVVVWRTINAVTAVSASIRRLTFTDGTSASSWLDVVWHRQESADGAAEAEAEWIEASEHPSSWRRP